MFDFSTPIERRGTYCTQWDFVADRFGQPDLLPFTISDMDLATAPCVQQALNKRMQHPVWGYSRWNHEDYKAAIVGWFARRFDTTIASDSIAYGPSVIYIVAQLLRLWSEPNDEVLVHTPAYDAFDRVIARNHRKMLRCPLVKGTEGHQIDWALFTELASRDSCKILLLCSPHNPTGRVWTWDELQRMDAICRTHGVKVISDEIHMDTVFAQHIPWARATKAQDWALVTSPSKSFNIPALGGAYAFLPDQQTRTAYLNQLKEADGLSSPSILAVVGLIAAYKEGDAWLDTLNIYLKENHKHLAERLNDRFPALNIQPPQGTYLAWLDLSPLNIDMARLQHQLIHEEKVAIMPGETYGSEGQQCIRINLGCSRQKMDDGIDRLIRAITAVCV